MDIIGTILSTGNDFITMFQSGGAIVYILTIIGLYGLFLAIEKIIQATGLSEQDIVALKTKNASA